MIIPFLILIGSQIMILHIFYYRLKEIKDFEILNNFKSLKRLSIVEK